MLSSVAGTSASRRSWSQSFGSASSASGRSTMSKAPPTTKMKGVGHLSFDLLSNQVMAAKPFNVIF